MTIPIIIPVVPLLLLVLCVVGTVLNRRERKRLDERNVTLRHTPPESGTTPGVRDW